jgi:hypothetical protein
MKLTGDDPLQLRPVANVPRAIGLLEALSVYPDPGVRRLASAALEALGAEPLTLEAQTGNPRYEITRLREALVEIERGSIGVDRLSLADLHHIAAAALVSSSPPGERAQ